VVGPSSAPRFSSLLDSSGLDGELDGGSDVSEADVVDTSGPKEGDSVVGQGWTDVLEECRWCGSSDSVLGQGRISCPVVLQAVPLVVVVVVATLIPVLLLLLVA
jgi:hypothetical protein